MAKLVSKKDLKYVNGYITDNEGTVVNIDYRIAHFLNKLEVCIQKAKYIKAQPECQFPPSLDGFELESEHKVYKIEEPKTPKLDARANLAKGILDEMVAVNNAKECNEFIKANAVVFEWLDSDLIVVDSSEAGVRFDLPTLGNPLELTAEGVMDIINEYDDVDECFFKE